MRAKSKFNAHNIVYIHAGKRESDVCDCLREFGWRYRVVDATVDTPYLETAGEPGVGIVTLTGDELPHVHAIEEAMRSFPRMQWIAVVSCEPLEKEYMRRFIEAHCLDYQRTPLDAVRLRAALGHAIGMALLVAGGQTGDARTPDVNIVAISPRMRDLKRNLERIGASDAPVLITGETGTGKELIARAIHRHSRRASGPFIAVNCASLAPTLIHSELFGHERGAFTGADERRVGYLENARGGSILLDEIADLPADLQTLLLRFLAEGSLRRVGGREDVRFDVRIMAATNVDLERAVSARRFRADLYYRLNVLRIELPPLRQRREDIEALALVSLEQFASERDRVIEGFTDEAVEAMRAYDWPGNVRELTNCVRRAAIMCTERRIDTEDLNLTDVGAADTETQTNLSSARMRAERESLLAALQREDWSASRAARLMGISRATFYRLLAKHRVSVDELGVLEESAGEGTPPARTH